MKPPASENANSRSSNSLTNSMKNKSAIFVICIDNTDYPASLEKRKIYESVPDSDEEQFGQIRVIDESGEDYLYSKELFVEANLPDEARSAVINAA